MPEPENHPSTSSQQKKLPNIKDDRINKFNAPEKKQPTNPKVCVKDLLYPPGRNTRPNKYEISNPIKNMII